MIPTVFTPHIEPNGDCRKCGAPAELFTWTFSATATHSQHRCVAGHIYCVDSR